MVLLVKKPEILLLLYFTLTISAINFDLPLGNIRYRPLIGILLLANSFIDYRMRIFQFFDHPGFRLIVLFFGYILFLSWGKGTLEPEVFRQLLLSIITAYLALYAYVIRNNTSILEASIVLSGLICLLDLVYTYKVIGHFPVQRIYYLFFPNSMLMEELNDTNHNFYGFICGIGFILIFSTFIWKRNKATSFFLWLMPLLFLGVLMSTSRSTLFGLIIASVFILYIGAKHVESRHNVWKTITFMGLLLGCILFLFISLQSFFDLDNSFISTIHFRLIEEPVAVIRKNLGLSYNVQNLDAMDWRKESAGLAWDAYTRLSVYEQLSGVGIGGYLQRNLGQNGLNPHNGVLYILLESGLAGFLMYFSFFMMAARSGIMNGVSPLFIVLFYILFYSLGQNEELISATAMLFISTLFSRKYCELMIYERENI